MDRGVCSSIFCASDRAVANQIAVTTRGRRRATLAIFRWPSEPCNRTQSPKASATSPEARRPSADDNGWAAIGGRRRGNRLRGARDRSNRLHHGQCAALRGPCGAWRARRRFAQTGRSGRVTPTKQVRRDDSSYPMCIEQGAGA